MGTTRGYDAKKYSINYCNTTLNSGWDDGEFLNISMEANDYEDKSGADGEVAVAKTNDRRATIKIKFLQTSQGNTTMVSLRETGSFGRFEVVETDTGQVVASAPVAWIQKPSDLSRGKEIVGTEWTLRAGEMNLRPVGAPPVTTV